MGRTQILPPYNYPPIYKYNLQYISTWRTRRDHMVVGFTITCAINAYHH